MRNRKKVLVVERISEAALRAFDARADVDYELLPEADPAAIAARIKDADALTIRAAPLPAWTLEGAPKLKIVSRHGVGFDNVPLAFCTARGIPVTVVGAVNSVAVAEQAMFLMLAAAKRGLRFDRAVRSGDFGLRTRATTMELRGKTLLLVGFGRIGQEVAARARPFGMSIAAFDPYAERARHPDVRFFDDLAAALGAADVVSLHVPLTEATRNLVDGAALARMRPGAILLNTARGGLVDEAALARALDTGHLLGAGLDVFAEEPPAPDNPLLAHERVVLSPHCAALSAECFEAMGEATVRNVLAAFDGTLDPALVVNPEVLPADRRG